MQLKNWTNEHIVIYSKAWNEVVKAPLPSISIIGTVLKSSYSDVNGAANDNLVLVKLIPTSAVRIA